MSHRACDSARGYCHARSTIPAPATVSTAYPQIFRKFPARSADPELARRSRCVGPLELVRNAGPARPSPSRVLANTSAVGLGTADVPTRRGSDAECDGLRGVRVSQPTLLTQQVAFKSFDGAWGMR